LDNAWERRAAGGKHPGKIEILGDHNFTVGFCVGKNDVIGSADNPDIQPVNRFKSR
jgi:hypothetical protein